MRLRKRGAYDSVLLTLLIFCLYFHYVKFQVGHLISIASKYGKQLWSVSVHYHVYGIAYCDTQQRN